MCVGAAPDPGQGGRAMTACHLCRIRMRRPLSVRGGRPVRGTTQRRGPPGCPRADPPADIRRQTRYATWTAGRQAGCGLHEAGVGRRLARSVRYPLHADPEDHVRTPSARKVHGRAGQHHASSGSSFRQYPPPPLPSAACAGRSLLQSAWLCGVRKRNGLDGQLLFAHHGLEGAPHRLRRADNDSHTARQ